MKTPTRNASPQAAHNAKDASTDTKVNTAQKVGNDGEKRLPHERDQSPDAQSTQPKQVMQQAKKDLDRGLVDTDMHGERGVEDVVKKTRSDQ